MNENLSLTINGIDIPLTIGTYNDGSVFVKYDKSKVESMIDDVVVVATPTTPTSQMQLFMLLGDLSYLVNNTHLYLKYLPYGRSDREFQSGEIFALRQFFQMLDSYRIGTVTITRPHSDKIFEWSYDYKYKLDTSYYQAITELANNYDAVIATDKGAKEWVTTELGTNFTKPILYANKIRNQDNSVTTPSITGLENLPNNSRVILMDDVIDGGISVINLSKHIKEINPTITIDCFVYHGIFSYGTDCFPDISTIYIINNLCNKELVIKLKF